MPHRNRVSPFGDIIAVPQRGRWMGNRGILHEGTSIVRPWQHPHWIICETSYKDWRAPQWTAHRYTPLFFLDEAVALAAGHRPCALCRYPRWKAFRDAWREVTGARDARRDEIDRRLQRERLKAHRRAWRDLPDGVFVVVDDIALRVGGDALRPWTPDGYGPPLTRPVRGHASVLTPAVTVEVLRAGYCVDL